MMFRKWRYYWQFLTQPTLKGNHLKIQLGSGANHFPGWINTDLFEAKKDFRIEPDYFLDISRKLPLADKSVRAFYSEHLIEHLPIEVTVFFFKEAYRVLELGGVMRVATPDLEYLVKKYQSPSWKKQDWLSWPEYHFIKTPSEMLNIATHWWGHQYLFDERELSRRLKEAGFRKVARQHWKKSRFQDLKNLETRRDSKLIFEAIKT